MNILNDRIRNQILFKLDKVDNINVDDLKLIDELVFDNYDILGNYEKINLDILKYLDNIKDLEFIHINFKDEELSLINNLKSLNRLELNQCNFSDLNSIVNNNIKILKIASSDVNSYDFLSNISSLDNLSLINLQRVPIALLNNLNVTELNLTNSDILDSDSKIEISSLKTLYITGTNLYIDNINFSICCSLSTIIIDDNIYEKNIDKIKELSSNIKFYDINMCLYEVSNT